MQDNVYVFNRGNCPVLVFNKDGDYLRHWGNPTPFDGVTPVTDPSVAHSIESTGTNCANEGES